MQLFVLKHHRLHTLWEKRNELPVIKGIPDEICFTVLCIQLEMVYTLGINSEYK